MFYSKLYVSRFCREKALIFGWNYEERPDGVNPEKTKIERILVTLNLLRATIWFVRFARVNFVRPVGVIQFNFVNFPK